MVQASLQSVFVEGFDALHKPNFLNTVRQKVVLSEKVLLLDFCV